METEYIYNIKRLDENEAILKDLKIYGYELIPSFDQMSMNIQLTMIKEQIH